MKVFIPLLAASLAFAAKKSPVEQLSALADANHGIIPLDQSSFELLTASKRNWSASIQFTALDPRRRCSPCKEFDPSWTAVAKAWTQTPKEHRDNHFFATLDFDNAQAVFQKLGLASAPVVYVYPPTEGPRQSPSGRTGPSKYDFSNGFDAQPLAEHLSAHTPIAIPYKAPIDWAAWGTTITAFLGFIVSLRYVLPILQNRWTWAAITVFSSIVFNSGYMFNRIRGVPWNGGNGQAIAPGFQTQYAQETQMIAMIYGTLAASLLMLIVVTPYTKSAGKQRIQVYIWSAVMMIIYSILVSIFRVKNRGYPFKLFF